MVIEAPSRVRGCRQNRHGLVLVLRSGEVMPCRPRLMPELPEVKDHNAERRPRSVDAAVDERGGAAGHKALVELVSERVSGGDHDAPERMPKVPLERMVVTPRPVEQHREDSVLS